MNEPFLTSKRSSLMLLAGLGMEAPMMGRISLIPNGAKLSGFGAFCEMHLVSLLTLSFSFSFWKV
jgi:hypothetical protein